MTAIGQAFDRVDGAIKTTGAAKFSADQTYPGLAHAALTHASTARGRITEIDTTDATRVPGVLAVITHHNAPKMKMPSVGLMPPVFGTTVVCLNTDEVHWDGQPVAVVVAETQEAARAAAARVRVSCSPLPSAVDFSTAEAKPQKNSMLQAGSARKGDALAALESAPVAVDREFTTPPHNHNAIEPHTTTAVWDGDRLTVHEPTQNIGGVRRTLSAAFGVPIDKIRVVSEHVGGGFGGKGLVWPGTILAVLAARVTGRPVRLVLTREGVYRTVGGRTPSVQRVAIGADREGRMTSLVHTSVTRVGRTGGGPEGVTIQSSHLYDARNILLRQNIAEVDLLANTFMRAPGEAIGTFALESTVDELAHELHMDPIDLRMRNEPTRDPIGDKPFTRRNLRAAYELGAKEFGWEQRTPQPRSMRDGQWLIGWGVATAFHPPVHLVANASLRFSTDGTALLRCGFHEMGMGAATAQAQITADALGIPFEAVRVEHGDSSLPAGPMAGGSNQTGSVAAAVHTLAPKLRRALGGEISVEALARKRKPYVEVSIGADSPLGRATGQARLMSKFLRDRRKGVRAVTGAQFCEVRVDADTGEIRVSRWVGAFDCGTVINPKTAASQLRGGIVLGIGAALSEETLVDPRTGRIMNPSLAEYHLPVHADVPEIDVHWLDEPDPTMPAGLLGVGEVGVTGAAAAVANAVFHATGKRVRDLPITLDKVV
ncbi:xanthine dehydrogenase family protein molybdopterin-binding subunit [Allokutzneria sp. A3M-2-11 16]|uniref:xanthine dehydrogenase family protein molybdopterin-binding subunit n=1 Tax=Allokutzneria sp. A3M-2-11 16 TaxID=2962043 RepID=UPI0020B6BECD|nr:xanthine dehydrogenase family protein molybdopterin-binding subunit [Allokutzneria sp. A3M-2-11 16]MCP3805346.1 xanthine dehydrogenase family protein molybdopterin-binding subunit [Allokutzneria sp. A3M-2-11 16]